MRNIYVAFLASNYKTGELIRFFTRAKYNHVALALEEDMNTLYSFSRLNYYEPFTAGFTQETLARYTVYNKPSYIKICKLEISDDHYARIEEKLRQYGQDVKAVYNYADVFVYPLNIHIPMEHIHTCISFVLENLEIPEFMKIKELEAYLDDRTMYEGSIQQYLNNREVKEFEYFVKHTNREKYKRYLDRNLHLFSQLLKALGL